MGKMWNRNMAIILEEDIRLANRGKWPVFPEPLLGMQREMVLRCRKRIKVEPKKRVHGYHGGRRGLEYVTWPSPEPEPEKFPVPLPVEKPKPVKPPAPTPVVSSKPGPTSGNPGTSKWDLGPAKDAKLIGPGFTHNEKVFAGNKGKAIRREVDGYQIQVLPNPTEEQKEAGIAEARVDVMNNNTLHPGKEIITNVGGRERKYWMELHELNGIPTWGRVMKDPNSPAQDTWESGKFVKGEWIPAEVANTSAAAAPDVEIVSESRAEDVRNEQQAIEASKATAAEEEQRRQRESVNEDQSTRVPTEIVSPSAAPAPDVDAGPKKQVRFPPDTRQEAGASNASAEAGGRERQGGNGPVPPTAAATAPTNARSRGGSTIPVANAKSKVIADKMAALQAKLQG